MELCWVVFNIYFFPRGWVGTISFLSGVIISIPFMNSTLYVGSFAGKYLNGADISYFVSLIVSLVVYQISIKIKERSGIISTT